MLDKWHKKEKPVFTGIARGIGGFGFGIPSAGGGGGSTVYTQNSGGSISNYEDGGTHYRAHIFTSPGELVIDDPDLIGQNLEYLIIAGGGGGGARHGGGGGAGGMYVSPGFPGVPTGENQGGNLTVPGPGIIGVTIGIGGGRGTGPSSWTDAKTTGHRGGPTYFGPPGSKLVEVVGGGGGGGYPHPTSAHPRMPGGAGGGGGNMPATQTGGVGNFPGGTGARMGHPGGNGGPAPAHHTGGGGGAGGSGVAANGSTTGPGGLGRQVWIAEPSSTPAVQASVGAPGPSGFTGSYFAGGGGGGGENAGTGLNGGGTGGTNGDSYGQPGLPGTGGGGGGARTPTAAGGGKGGSGIAIVRYQIPGSQGTAKASGGVISFYNGKTIHAFHGPGRFVTASPIAGCEIVLIGGGGGGGATDYQGSYSDGSGGGGAGAYIKKSGVTISGPSDIVIGKGGTGATAFAGKTANINHNGSGSPSTAAGHGENGYVTTGFGYTADGGGGGGNGGNSPAMPGHVGASGGGAARHPATGGATNVSQFYPGPKDASADTPNNGWGHPGGATGQPAQRAGGGGGAGRNGWDATNGQPRSWTPGGEGDTEGLGGAGMQLPATFRDPNCRIGARGPTNVSSDNPGVSGLDNSGYYWVCGGGGGGADFPQGLSGRGNKAPGGGEGPGGAPWSGGGCGGGNNGDTVMGAGGYPGDGGSAYENTGGGGGGSSGSWGGADSHSGGNGGSGLVLVAYPT